MSKSEGNHITLKTLIEKGFSPLAYRYFLLMAHYRTPVNFSWEALEAAENAYRKLKEFYHSLIRENGKVSESYKKSFQEAVENDLNTPEALGIVWKLVKDESVSPADKRATLLDFDEVLGLDLEHNEFEVRDIPPEVEKLLEARRFARASSDYKQADELREQIKEFGFIVEDSGSEQRISKI